VTEKVLENILDTGSRQMSVEVGECFFEQLC